MLGSGTMRQITSNDEMEDIMKIIKFLEYSGSLVKQSKMKQKNKGGFLSMLLGTLSASLLGNIIAGKGITRAGYGSKGRKGLTRAGYGSKLDF